LISRATAPTEKLWLANLRDHKTAHRAKERTIYIGPLGQRQIAPHLLKGADEYVFVPQWKRSNGHYTTDSYRRAIQRACERRYARKVKLWAKRYPDRHYPRALVKWSPNQLRKATATSIRAKLDVESAASVLGHSSPTVTGEHYAARDRQRAIEAARLLG